MKVRLLTLMKKTALPSPSKKNWFISRHKLARNCGVPKNLKVWWDSIISMKTDHTLTMVNFKPTALEALFAGFKNQIARINLKNGEILWGKYLHRPG